MEVCSSFDGLFCLASQRGCGSASGARPEHLVIPWDAVEGIPVGIWVSVVAHLCEPQPGSTRAVLRLHLSMQRQLTVPQVSVHSTASLFIFHSKIRKVYKPQELLIKFSLEIEMEPFSDH